MSCTAGILALQGGFEKHAFVCRELGYTVRLVKTRSDFDCISSLIVPGGESTVMLRLLERRGFRDYLAGAVAEGLPYFGTCAGMVLASRKADKLPFNPLSLIDLEVERNSYGRQKDSFRKDVSTQLSETGKIPGVFIRAPRVISRGSGIDELGFLDGCPVIFRRKNVLVASFHPELTGDYTLHRYFFEKIAT